MASRKSFPLRINAELYEEIKAWAEREMRSVNGQIEYLLKEAVQRLKRSSTERSESEEGEQEQDEEPRGE